MLFTERRSDLRRHAGEISFPGGRPDEGDEDLATTALREAQEEIALSPEAVRARRRPAPHLDLRHRLPHPPLRRPDPRSGELELAPNPGEVETVLSFSLDLLREGYAMRRLIRRGVPIHTPTYEVDGHLIWGATARILGDLLERLT